MYHSVHMFPDASLRALALRLLRSARRPRRVRAVEEVEVPLAQIICFQIISRAASTFELKTSTIIIISRIIIDGKLKISYTNYEISEYLTSSIRTMLDQRTRDRAFR